MTIHELTGDIDRKSCKETLILHLKCLFPTLLITGVTTQRENGRRVPVNSSHPLAVPRGNASIAVWIQTYQGLLRDLRTRSKTCRRTQSKLNLTSTSSLRL